jgi:hypothetical protein
MNIIFPRPGDKIIFNQDVKFPNKINYHYDFYRLNSIPDIPSGVELVITKLSLITDIKRSFISFRSKYTQTYLDELFTIYKDLILPDQINITKFHLFSMPNSHPGYKNQESILNDLLNIDLQRKEFMLSFPKISLRFELEYFETIDVTHIKK